ncbi:MAG: hypothetical protein RL490_1331 [Pseudomonadota bacterium]|jgi:uncharacterized sulfatase
MRIARALAHWLFASLLLVLGPAVRAAGPNIIVILADDLGLGDIGAYGNRQIRTPHIDSIAKGGARLDQFFASANVCTPSRAGLLTGRYPARAGLADGVIFPHSDYGLPAAMTTLPQALKGAGYRTAMLGKWHLGASDAAWPTEHGFDRFWGIPYSNDMNPLPLYRGKAIIEPVLTQETFAARMVDEARAVIAEKSDQPFFLYVAQIAPHVPLRPGAAFRGKSSAGVYGDAVEEVDWTVGEILKAVKTAGKDRDTIIIFTSDNGPWWEGSAADRRGGKGGTFEGGYAVPMLARWPGHIKPGSHSPAIAMNIDLMPTLCAIAGATLQADQPLDGRDILPVLQGARASPHDHLLFFANDQIAAVRTQDWRLLQAAYYITLYAPLYKYGYNLLFDAKSDTGEHYSLADRHPDVVKRLTAIADAARTEFGAIPQRHTDPFAKKPAILPVPEAQP